jgi:hypothetical protein
MKQAVDKSEDTKQTCAVQQIRKASHCGEHLQPLFRSAVRKDLSIRVVHNQLSSTRQGPRHLPTATGQPDLKAFRRFA